MGGLKNSNRYVSSYSLSYSNNGQSWNVFKVNLKKKIFMANKDGDIDVLVKNKLPNGIVARFLRINVNTYSSEAPCLRLELYGCEVAPVTTPKATTTEVKVETTPKATTTEVKVETTPKATTQEVKVETTPKATTTEVKVETTPKATTQEVKVETTP